MPKLTIENLTGGDFVIQDPTGLYGFTMDVDPGDTEAAVLSLEAFAEIEAMLVAAAAAGQITWTVEDDPDVLADSIRPLNDLYGNDLGAPDLADADYFLNIVNMQATAYTLDETELAADNPPRNVTLTHAIVDTEDTLGDAVLTGTDFDDEVITETVALVASSEVTSTKAFKTLTSVVTAGWVQAGASPDTITVGFGTLLGLAQKLSATREVFLATVDGVAVKPSAIAVNATVVSKNTVDLSGAIYDSAKLVNVAIRRTAIT